MANGSTILFKHFEDPEDIKSIDKHWCEVEEMSQISHKTWIEPLKIASIVDNNVTLVSEDSFKRDMADTKFHDLIMNTFSIILQKNCNF